LKKHILILQSYADPCLIPKPKILNRNRYELLGIQDSCRLGDDRFDERFVA